MPRSCNSEAGRTSPNRHFDALGQLSRHRQYNSPIARHLMLDTGTRDIGQKIANCALTIKAGIILHPELPPETNLTAARVCNTRLCPFCEWRRTRVWRQRLFNGLTSLYEHQPKLRGVFLTLTVRNVQLDALGDQLDQMNRAWNRMVQRSFFPTDLWFRRTEVTVGQNLASGAFTAHPHFHVLLLVRPSYFSHGYVRQTEWQKQWMDSARLDYVPVVDVRSAKAKSIDGSTSAVDAKGAVMEAAKYAAKATDLMELGPAITELHWQLRHRRLYALSKQLREYVKAGEVSEAELLDDDSKPLPPGAERIEVLAQWFEDTQDYQIVDIKQP